MDVVPLQAATAPQNAKAAHTEERSGSRNRRREGEAGARRGEEIRGETHSRKSPEARTREDLSGSRQVANMMINIKISYTSTLNYLH